jgi:hypothetical protein
LALYVQTVSQAKLLEYLIIKLSGEVSRCLITKLIDPLVDQLLIYKAICVHLAID